MPIIGSKAPVFELEGVLKGDLNKWKIPVGDGKTWTLLLFYPLDFTFVCPTEIIAFSDAADKFKELNTQLFGVSIDSKFTHLAWTTTPESEGGVGGINYPLLSDLNKKVAEAYGVLTEGGVALRGLFLIDEEGTIQHTVTNNLSVGRGVDETLRTVQAFQHTKKTGEVCPANWKPGAETMKPNPKGLKEYASKHGKKK